MTFADNAQKSVTDLGNFDASQFGQTSAKSNIVTAVTLAQPGCTRDS